MPGLCRELSANLERAGEGDLADNGRLYEPVGDEGRIAGGQVNDPRWHVRVEDGVKEVPRGQRSLLGYLGDDRAAGGEGGGDVPCRLNEREIPWREHRNGADRLLDDLQLQRPSCGRYQPPVHT